MLPVWRIRRHVHHLGVLEYLRAAADFLCHSLYDLVDHLHLPLGKYDDDLVILAQLLEIVDLCGGVGLLFGRFCSSE